MTENRIAANCRLVLSEIEAACQNSQRSLGSVQLVCIAKGQPAAAVQELLDSAIFPKGPILGENYIQEWSQKRNELQGAYTVHFTGRLQSNKLKKAVELFDVIQTVADLKTAQAISAIGQQLNKIITIFLQVNISNDPDKQGFLVDDLLQKYWPEISALPALSVQGLMTITRLYEDPELARPDFRAMKALRDQLVERYQLEQAPLLSMGMSGDFQVAIEEGADLIRVGTAIFGER